MQKSAFPSHHPRHTSRSTVSRVAGVCALALALVAWACSSDPHLNGSADVGGKLPNDEVPVGPCTEGASRECSVTLGSHNGVLSCYHGTRYCVDGEWSACGDGTTSEMADYRESGDYAAQALSTPSQCVGNPCDPFCQGFTEQPDAGLVPDASNAYDWPTGSFSGMPNGLVNKGLNEPCESALDCQFNTSCEEPVTGGSCGHSKCSSGSALDATCDSCVAMICAADPSCCSVPAGSCGHSMCESGSKLKSNCDSCVSNICAVDPYCCNTKWDSICVGEVKSVCGKNSCSANWGTSCVNKVATVCGATCGAGNPPAESGECVPWLPGETDPACTGVDLAVGIPCENKIPVCNHGSTVAPAGIRIVHFPANSNQYPKCDPNLSHPQMKECFTTEAIPPGECRSTVCANLGNGNREIMVNPSGTAHINECTCLNNWSLFSGGTVCGPPSCAGTVETVRFKPVNMYFVVDRSGSMGGTKWTGTTDALKAFFASTNSAGLGAALEFFPLSSGGNRGDGCPGSSCSSTECSNPMVPLGKLTAAASPTDTQEQALTDAVDSLSPGGGTPTYPALDGALNWARTNLTATPNEIFVVVLVTDGEPTECNSSNSAIANLAGAAFTNDQIRTYTIGMQGANITALDSIANKGGTGQAIVVSGTNSSSVAQQLIDAFAAIAKQNISCTFDLPSPGSFDPNDVKLLYSTNGGTASPLTHVNGSAQCGSGWYYDSNANPTKATLCPATCSAIQSDPKAQLELAVGCPKLFTSTPVSQVYDANCPIGSKPQWGYFAYDTSTPSDSNIVFEARTANLQADLASATFAPLKTAKASPNTQVCAMGGPSPCPVDLYAALGALAAKNRYLELRATLNPSSNRMSAPQLNDWNVTFSCPPGE